MDKDIGIYIHIPFCKSKCFYCNFNSNCNMDEYIQNYIDSLCEEIIQNAEILSQYNIKTIYFGGGTPSYIDSKYIKKILSILSMFIKNKEDLEITIEVNPGTVDFEKLYLYKKEGINRLSIGLQSTHDDILKKIGRIHNLKDFKNTIEIANKVGFENISIDIIYPLPGLNIKLFEDTINYICSLKQKNIKHISIYNLEIHENTKLGFLLKEGYLNLANEDEEYEMKELLNKKLYNAGYINYEISNYSISGYESKHNLNYWTQGQYLGFGSSASSFFSGTRYKNIDDIKMYITNMKNNITLIQEKNELNKLDLMKEYIILFLRLNKGVSILNFFKKFGVDIFEVFNTEIVKLLECKLLELSKDKKNIYLTKRGKEVANIVWQEFI